MNPTKAAATLALAVTVAAAAYLCYQLYENVILLKSANASVDCLDLKLKYGDSYDCNETSPGLIYGISAGVAIVSLIVSLALFGAAKPKR